jgi:hypothetical protein
MALAKSQKSLKKWTKQDWKTKSGKPSTQGAKATGERYLPAKAIKSLTSAEYSASTSAKRRGTAKGKQHVAQPKKVAAKVKKFRRTWMPEIIMERVLKWQLMPRIMMLAVTILSYQAVHWFMSLPDPSIQQSGLVSVCMGALTGCFAVWLGNEKH